MTRSARNSSQTPKPSKPRPSVENEKISNHVALVDNGTPVRTVIYLEVGDMLIAAVQQAVAHVSHMYGQSRHPTFICPVRNGKLSTDALFEEDIMTFVRAVCEVKDGEIVLRGSPVEVNVLRTTV